MGYDLAQLKSELAEVPLSAEFLTGDLVRFAKGSVAACIHPKLIRRSLSLPRSSSHLVEFS